MNVIFVESNNAIKTLCKVPVAILKKYEIWKRLVEIHGTKILHSLPGYHFEKLSGQRDSQYSIRLNRQWRVVFNIDKNKKIEIITIIKVTAHDYRIR